MTALLLCRKPLRTTSEIISLLVLHRSAAAGHACDVQFFSHPDYTVGFGIAPNLPEGSRTIPPVGTCTLPRRTYSIEEIIAPRIVRHNTKKYRESLSTHSPPYVRIPPPFAGSWSPSTGFFPVCAVPPPFTAGRTPKARSPSPVYKDS